VRSIFKPFKSGLKSSCNNCKLFSNNDTEEKLASNLLKESYTNEISVFAIPKHLEEEILNSVDSKSAEEGFHVSAINLRGPENEICNSAIQENFEEKTRNIEILKDAKDEILNSEILENPEERTDGSNHSEDEILQVVIPVDVKQRICYSNVPKCPADKILTSVTSENLEEEIGSSAILKDPEDTARDSVIPENETRDIVISEDSDDDLMVCEPGVNKYSCGFICQACFV